MILRSGAKPGDFIFVTGPLGGSIKGRHLNFVPRVTESRMLTRDYCLHAMMDISDGLVQDLGQVLKASRCGAILYEELIPVHPDAEGINDALYSGEDFELLFTLGRPHSERLLRERSPRVYPIGEVVAGNRKVKFVYRSGKERVLEQKGYRHF